MTALSGLLAVTSLAMHCPPDPNPPGNGVSQIALQPVASGLTSPVFLTFPPDDSGRLFVLDQIGLIRVIDSGGNLLPDAFLDLRDRMVTLNNTFDERGLLGLAFHPSYAQNGRFFVFYTAPKSDQVPAESDSETHISEFQVSAGNTNLADASSERLILRIAKPQSNHNGGHIEFGPDDYLYIATGDGGAANDQGTGHNPDIGNGRDRGSLLGKILRIDVDMGDPYGIPPDNPFVGVPGARAEIYAYGLRNPYRFAFDSGGDRRLFAADVGQDRREEVSIIEKGGHYGWRIREGHDCFNPDQPDVAPPSCDTTDPVTGDDLIPPILDYPHPGENSTISGLSAIGGHVYRGSAIPGLVGDYVFGDWSTGFVLANGTLLAATEANGAWTLRELSIADDSDGRLGQYILGFGRDAAGELYLLTSERTGPTGTTGLVRRIVAAP